MRVTTTVFFILLATRLPPPQKTAARMRFRRQLAWYFHMTGCPIAGQLLSPCNQAISQNDHRSTRAVVADLANLHHHSAFNFQDKQILKEYVFVYFDE